MDNNYEMAYEYKVLNAIKYYIKEIIFIILILFNVVLTIIAGKRLGFDRGIVMAVACSLLTLYKMSHVVSKIISKFKKDDIKEYRGFIRGITKNNTIIIQYLKENGSILYGEYYAPGFDAKVFKDYVCQRIKCKIKVNKESMVLLEVKKIDEDFSFPKIRNEKIKIMALNYKFISNEPWYAYLGFFEILFFCAVGIIIGYFGLVTSEKTGIFLAYSLIVFLFVDLLDEIKSVKVSLSVKNIKDKGTKKVDGCFINTRCIDVFYSHFWKKTTRYCARICILNDNNVDEYYIYVKKDLFPTVWNLANENAKIRIEYYEGTNILKSFETID